MNSFLAVATLLAALACAQAGLLVGPSANIIQGPSSRSTIVGPDGSAIVGAAPGGQIITEEHPGVVAHTAPIVAAHGVVAHSAPIVAAHGVVAHSAPVVAHHGVVAAHGIADTVVAGPSGTIATSRHLAAPAVLSAAVPAVHSIHGIHGIHGVHGIHGGLIL